jgi:hypothetical protein
MKLYAIWLNISIDLVKNRQINIPARSREHRYSTSLAQVIGKYNFLLDRVEICRHQRFGTVTSLSG